MATAVADITRPCTPDEARKLTERINTTAGDLYRLLLESHERGAHVALGYASWREYAASEFDISHSYAYRLLDHGKVVAAIEAAAGKDYSPVGETITERAARDIKPVLPAVTDQIRQAVAAGTPPQEAVAAAVQQQRQPQRGQEPDGDDGTDLVAELEAAHKTITEQQEVIESLTKDDAARELRAQQAKYAQLSARLDVEVERGNQAVKQAKWAMGLLEDVKKLLGVTDPRNVVQTLRQRLGL